MKTIGTNLKIVGLIKSIKNGAYQGVWSGHVVNFRIDDIEYQCDTEIGVRGLNHS